jgi:predicted RNA methylase
MARQPMTTKPPTSSSAPHTPLEQPKRIDGLTSPWAQNLADALRAGQCPTDAAFDRFLPYELRLLSSEHWTPLVAALRAAQWLDEVGAHTVVDIGSGAGKFCVAAALAGRCRFTGLEHRARLVMAARELARVFEVDDRVRFSHSVFGRTPTPAADAYYLYNPFGENVFGSEQSFGEDVEVTEERYARDIATVESLLECAPDGTYLVTYNGFGGRVPRSYESVRIDRELPNVLCMWRRVRSRGHRSRGTCPGAATNLVENSSH